MIPGRSVAAIRFRLGIAADPKTTLGELASALRGRMTEAEHQAAAARLERIGKARADVMARVGAAAQAEAERTPIGQAHLMHTLAGLLPRDAVVVDESATSLPFVLRYVPFSTPGSFYGGKTGTLGWGMGAAIGVQLGSPGRKVVATIGDGSLMYAPQALWTAAHYQLPITYVIPNNSSYAILKSGMLSLDLASAKRGIYPGMRPGRTHDRLRRPRTIARGPGRARREARRPARRARLVPRPSRTDARGRRDRPRLQGDVMVGVRAAAAGEASR